MTQRADTDPLSHSDAMLCLFLSLFFPVPHTMSLHSLRRVPLSLSVMICSRAKSSLSIIVKDHDVGLHAGRLPATGLLQVVLPYTSSQAPPPLALFIPAAGKMIHCLQAVSSEPQDTPGNGMLVRVRL